MINGQLLPIRLHSLVVERSDLLPPPGGPELLLGDRPQRVAANDSVHGSIYFICSDLPFGRYATRLYR